MTNKLIIVSIVACIALGFALGWWAHPDLPEQPEAYSPPKPDSIRTEQLAHAVDSLSTAADSLVAELERKDMEDHAVRRRIQPPSGGSTNVLPLQPLPIPEISRRDSVIRYLAAPWIDYHKFEARKKDSTYIAGTIRIRVEPIRKQSAPTVQIDSVRVLIPPRPEPPGQTKTVLAWTAVALAIGLIVGKIL